MESTLLSKFWHQPPTSPKSKDKGRLDLPTPSESLSALENDDDDDVPPPPPPKDPGYSPYNGYFIPQQYSQSSLAPPRSAPGPRSTQQTLGQTTLNRLPSAASSQTSLVQPVTPATPYLSPTPSSSGSKFRFGLPRLKKRPSTKTTGASSIVSSQEDDISGHSHTPNGDEGITLPWNFKHNVHVDEALAGLPVEWASTLQQAGYSVNEIRRIYSKEPRPDTLSPSSSSASTSSYTQSQPVAGPSTQPAIVTPTLVIPRPRKDSIKHTKKTTETDQPPAPPSKHQPAPSIDDVVIAVATTVKRSPSALKRIPAPPWPSPPPSYESSNILASTESSTNFPTTSKLLPLTEKQGQTTLSPSSQPSPEKGLRPRKSSSSIRLAIQNTINHAKSSASLRKPSSSESAGPSSFKEPTAGPSRKKSTRSTFWDDEDDDDDRESAEIADQVPPLPLNTRTSNRSLKGKASAPPPRLELSLPFSDQPARKDSEESPTILYASSTPRANTAGTNGSFFSYDFGGTDLGLGEWGSELLKAVLPGEEGSNIPSPLPSTPDPQSRAGATTSFSSRSSGVTVTSPNSINTTFSMQQPSVSSQTSHSHHASSGPKHVSLLPVVPLKLPPKKSGVNLNITTERASEDSEQSGSDVDLDSKPESPVLPGSPEVKTVQVVLPPPSPKHDLPEPPAALPPQLNLPMPSSGSRQLSMLIKEEYGDFDDHEEDDRLLAYLQPSPGPLQAKFDMLSPQSSPIAAAMSRSTSSSTSEASSMSFGANSSVTSSNASSDHGSTITKSPAQRHFSSSGTLTPTAFAKFVKPPSSPNSPYDGVLEDWFESDAGHQEPDVLSPAGGPKSVQALREEGMIRDVLPPILVPLAQYVHRCEASQFTQFQIVAEGQYGGVYAARSSSTNSVAAIKAITVEEANEPKFLSLKKELSLLNHVRHDNVLVYDGVFLVDHEDSIEGVSPGPMLWLEMEMMERSLADVLAFVPEGLTIEEPQIARFACDILEGLDYLQGFNIAHRDVRSDSLLFSKSGSLKIADFSSATLTSADSPTRSSTHGQPPYWMAPEMLRGQSYDPHEADIWSVGATIWEVAEGDPPFIEVEDPRQFLERWPELHNADRYSTHFHEFLRCCSEPAGRRPRAVELLRSPFVRQACPLDNITKLLIQARCMEEEAKGRPSLDN